MMDLSQLKFAQKLMAPTKPKQSYWRTITSIHKDGDVLTITGTTYQTRNSGALVTCEYNDSHDFLHMIALLLKKDISTFREGANVDFVPTPLDVNTRRLPANGQEYMDGAAEPAAEPAEEPAEEPAPSMGGGPLDAADDAQIAAGMNASLYHGGGKSPLLSALSRQLTEIPVHSQGAPARQRVPGSRRPARNPRRRRSRRR